MNIDRLKYLFWQRYSGKITPEEEQEFQVFVKDPENQVFLETCIETFLEQAPDLPLPSQEKVEGIMSRILSRPASLSEKSAFSDAPAFAPDPAVSFPSRPIPLSGFPVLSDDPASLPRFVRLRLLRKWSWAAAIILIAGIGLFLARSHMGGQQPLLAHRQEKIQTEIPPGGDKAVLTLADGRKITLDSMANGSIAEQGNTRIVQAAGGKLAYTKGATSTQAVPGSEVLYNMITTPRGGQYQVILPDGTKVWLNAASSIKFPTAFTGKSRTIELTGEAYLEVSKNKLQPFRVMTNGIEIAVLGTSFNVNAYSDETAVNTTLLEGSIAVASVVLRSGQQAQIHRSNGRQPQPPVIVDGVDLDRVVAWKNGRFNFNDADVYTVMRQLSRWYDLTIQFEGEAPKLKIKGEMGRDLNLSEMLDLLREMGIRFRLEGRTLIVEK